MYPMNTTQHKTRPDNITQHNVRQDQTTQHNTTQHNQRNYPLKIINTTKTATQNHQQGSV
jgi:hypothetical protein